jgi:small subunit ribosomal protein S1
MGLSAGDKTRAKVVDVEDNGIYLSYEDSSGFINVTNITWRPGRVDPKDFAKPGESIEALVYAVTPTGFYASIKDLHPELDPWKDPTVYAPGTHHTGRVQNVVPFGAIVELSSGLLGLLPAEQAEGLRAGDSVNVRVASQDAKLKKLEFERAQA